MKEAVALLCSAILAIAISDLGRTISGTAVVVNALKNGVTEMSVSNGVLKVLKKMGS